MWPLSNKKEGAHSTFVLDIGSSRVMGAVVEYEYHESKDGNKTKTWAKPVVIHTARRVIPFRDEFQPRRHLRDTASALRETAFELVRLGHTTPDRILVTLSPLLTLGDVRVVTRTDHEGKEVTATLLDDVAKEAGAAFMAEQGRGHILESTISGVRLNGYLVPDPIGKMADSIETNVFTSIIDAATHDAIQIALTEIFHERPVEYRSFAGTATMALMRVTGLDNFRYMECGGEATELIDVAKGVMTAVRSIPFGTRPLLRTVAQNLHISPALAASRLRMAEQNIGQNTESAEAKTLIDAASPLLGRIKGALTALCNPLGIALGASDWTSSFGNSHRIPGQARDDSGINPGHHRNTPLLILAEPPLDRFVLGVAEPCVGATATRIITAESLTRAYKLTGEADGDRFLMLAVIFSGIMEMSL